MWIYRIFGSLVCGLFLILSSTGWSCSDDRGSGLIAAGGSSGYSRGGSYRTYHK